jgi:hypothetical protein
MHLFTVFFPIRVVFLAACLFIPFGAFPLNLQDVLPDLSEKERLELAGKKELVYFSDSAPRFKLLPRHAVTAGIRRQFQGYSPGVTNEVYFLLPFPGAAGGGSESVSTHLYSRLRAISSLSGIEYFSNHFKTTRVLFSEVYEVDNLDSRQRVADRIASSLPVGEERFPIHINDVNFGSGYYEAVFWTADGALSFGFRNRTNLSYFFIPIIGEERVRFQFAAIPLREDGQLLVYGICAVEANDFIRGLIDLPSSFHTRIKALRDWFIKRIY